MATDPDREGGTEEEVGRTQAAGQGLESYMGKGSALCHTGYYRCWGLANRKYTGLGFSMLLYQIGLHVLTGVPGWARETKFENRRLRSKQSEGTKEVKSTDERHTRKYI